MFTGIVEETGAVKAFEKGAAGARLEIEAAGVLSDLQLGGSIAVNGCCLTAVAISASGFSADLSPETLDKTNLGDLAAGARVNLERPLLPSSRLSGHFVQGHVDGTGELLGIDPLGEGNWKLRVRAPSALLHYLVYKGSVAIDGISLTIADLVSDVIEVAIIPHTFQETNLGGRKPGERVNLEVDILAKYVARQLEARSS
jgi:riboflavin synthase